MKLALFYLGLILLSIAVQVRGEDAKAVDSNEEDVDVGELAERGGSGGAGNYHGNYPSGAFQRYKFCQSCKNRAAEFCEELEELAEKHETRGLAERHGNGGAGGGANQEFCIKPRQCRRAYGNFHCRFCNSLRW